MMSAQSGASSAFGRRRKTRQPPNVAVSDGGGVVSAAVPGWERGGGTLEHMFAPIKSIAGVHCRCLPRFRLLHNLSAIDSHFPMHIHAPLHPSSPASTSSASTTSRLAKRVPWSSRPPMSWGTSTRTSGEGRGSWVADPAQLMCPCIRYCVFVPAAVLSLLLTPVLTLLPCSVAVSRTLASHPPPGTCAWRAAPGATHWTL